MENVEDRIEEDGQESQTNGDPTIEETKAPQEEEIETNDNQLHSPDRVGESEPVTDSDDTSTEGTEHPKEEIESTEDDSQGDQEANNQDSGTEMAVAVIQTEEPMSEALTYMGMDSTALIDIAFVEPDISDENQKALTTWIAKAEKLKKGKKVDRATLIKGGIGLTGGLVAESNRLINVAAKNYADRAIAIGTICLILKELTRGSDTPWGVWAEENLPFLSNRNRQKFMLLARRTDCHELTHLGVDRMEVLCSLTKASEEDNPIGVLLTKYSISFDETSEVDMAEFKKKIDAAISNERLVKNSIEVNFNSVTSIVNIGIDFDKALIKRLKDIKECGGNPETLLENLALTQGADDPEADAEKRLQDFNTLSTRLAKTIDYIIRERDHLDNLDKDAFDTLFEKLEELKKVSNIGVEKKQE